MDDETRPRIPISADWVLKRIQEGKRVRLKNAIIKGNLNPDVKIIQSCIKITNSTIYGEINFYDATFYESVCFEGVTIYEDVKLNVVTFRENASFQGTTFIGYAWIKRTAFSSYASFERSTFREYASFQGTTFRENASFQGTTFIGSAHFEETTFIREAWFQGTMFNRNALFAEATFSMDTTFLEATFRSFAYFEETTFKQEVSIVGAKFEGEFLTFRNATFFLPSSMEEACRKAKNVLAKAGNRDEEEYHFYREMEAKRIQKGIRGDSGLGLGHILAKTDTWSSWRYFRYDAIEWLFVQGMFGYGVHPKRLMISWGAIVLAFGFFYWYGDGIIGTTGWLDYIK